MMNSFHVFIIITQALYISIWCVWGQVLCVCAMCFAPTQSVSRWKAGLPSGLISSPQTVDCDSFRRLLIWHIWSPSMWQWMLTSADSTLLHFQLIAASVAPLWKDFHLSQTCVCVCSKGPTSRILSLGGALTEQNYCPVWSHIVYKIIVGTYNMLSWQEVGAQRTVRWPRSGWIQLTKHRLLTDLKVQFVTIDRAKSVTVLLTCYVCSSPQKDSITAWISLKQQKAIIHYVKDCCFFFFSFFFYHVMPLLLFRKFCPTLVTGETIMGETK